LVVELFEGFGIMSAYHRGADEEGIVIIFCFT